MRWLPGIRYLGADAPDIVIIVYADRRLADTAIDRRAAACLRLRAGPCRHST